MFPVFFCILVLFCLSSQAEIIEDNQQEKQQQPPRLIKEIDKRDFSELESLCKEIREFNACFSKAIFYLLELDIQSLDEIQNLPQTYINKISFLYNTIGKIDFYGLIDTNPNLEKGLSNIIIAAYFGNPAALYSLYNIFENDLVTKIINTTTFNDYLLSNKVLSEITKTKFYSNFNITLTPLYNVDLKNSIANNFLFSSALAHYDPAMNVLGNKFSHGYGFEHNCDVALKYYMESSHETIKDITDRKTRNLYQYPLLIDYEYIEKKFETKVQENILDKIDYLALSAQKGDKTSTKKLADLYLFGIGLKKNLKESFRWFKHGANLNDSACIYYLGEMYLNGWGTEKNYKEALNLFELAAKYNYTKAFNSLGYMYFYGYGVIQNTTKAYDYFQKAIKQDKVQDAYFNAITMLLDDKSKIKSDFSTAYQYANSIASQGHTFGSYFFAMMNHFNLGAAVNLCEINLEYFKLVAERNIIEKNKFDLASEFYFSKKYRSSALLYMELAEEGFEAAQINAAILLKNHPIFKDKDYQNFLAFKYIKMASKNDNLFAIVTLADYYFDGFGELKKNYPKAMSLYKKVITQPTLNFFYQAHSRFKVGFMYSFGLGVEKNLTLANMYFEKCKNSKTAAMYPAIVMMKYNEFMNNTYFNFTLKEGAKTLAGWFFYPKWKTFLYIFFIIFYISFFISLKLQSE